MEKFKDRKATLSVQVDEETYFKIKIMAEENSHSISDEMRKIITAAINERFYAVAIEESEGHPATDKQYEYINMLYSKLGKKGPGVVEKKELTIESANILIKDLKKQAGIGV